MGQGIHGCQGGTSRTTSVTLPVSQSDVENTSDNLGPVGVSAPPIVYSGMPRLWMPARACLACRYPNDFDFNYCQKCGTPSTLVNTVTVRGRNVDQERIDKRYEEIMNVTSSSAYAKQKRVLEAQLGEFLGALQPAKTLDSATPKDIVRFLIWKDDDGKTRVHVDNCDQSNSSCLCPYRLAFKTVDSYVGKLRSIFSKHGRGGEWDERLGLGNPAASPIVKDYLKAVTGEQLQQGITPQQAKPLFLPKIIKVCQYIVQQIETEKSPIKLFIRARDQAIFKAVFFAGDRVGDLLRTRTNQVYRLTSGALLFNHVWGKTLRDGRQNVFALEKTGDTASCPVEAIDFYVDMAEYLSVNLSGGMLFRATSKQGQVLENQPTTSAVDESFKRYLEKCGIYEGERLHGSRAGCAISLHMAGASEEEVMSHVGWVTKRTASHYMKIAKVMKPGGPASKLATEHVSKAVQEYMEQDNLVGLQPAF
ncbi:uncharacterized protein LOC144909439 [Branchiostoma floridae x Branchiostoma belcheri]